jgi:hypothetical protein
MLSNVNSSDGMGSVRPLRLSIVATLLLLTLQGWFGDFVNVFVTTTPTASVSYADITTAIFNQGAGLILHALIGFLIFFAGIGALVVAHRHKIRNVTIATALGLLAVLSAGIGGILFVTSGFSAGGSSMQMGGSYIAAYALYFIALYYTK